VTGRASDVMEDTETPGRDIARSSMILPFKAVPRAKVRVSAPADKPTNQLCGWANGTYVVGVLDGAVVGATPLGNGMRLLDPTDVVEVMTMLSEYLPVEVRATVREELLVVYRNSMDGRVFAK
jgi:hypothetical protein